MINAVHLGQLSVRQREALTGLLTLTACSSGMAWCPETSPVQSAYSELLAADPGSAR